MINSTKGLFLLLCVLLFPAASGAQGIMSTVTKADGDIIRLRNGTIVEKSTYTYLGYIGLSEEALLFNMDDTSYLWIENKGLFAVEILRVPDYYLTATLELVTIKASSDELIVTDDGRVYETYDFPYWYAGERVVLVDGSRMINLDQDDGVIIDVHEL